MSTHKAEGLSTEYIVERDATGVSEWQEMQWDVGEDGLKAQES